MGRLKKILAIILCGAVVLGMCSCSFNSDFRYELLETADILAKNIVNRNYVNIKNMGRGEDPQLQSILSFSDSDSQEDTGAKAMIASTLQYEVRRDSIESDIKGHKGSIDITFTYVNYETVALIKPIFGDTDDFGATVDECREFLQTTVTFDFVSENDKLICTNISDIAQVFPYSDYDFNFALARSEYAGTIGFGGDNYDLPTNTYCDTLYITARLPINGDGQLLEWNYYYTIVGESGPLYTSDIITVTDRPCEMLKGDYCETFILPEGEYVFTYLTEDDEIIAQAPINISNS